MLTMKLYNLTLHPNATSVYAVTGNFLGTNGGQEIVVAQGGFFSLLCPDSSGQLKALHSFVEHSSVCSLARLTGSHKDRVLVGLNSVNVFVIGYTNPEDPKLEKYFKLNFRNPSDTSIHFITSDPYGKAFIFSVSGESKNLLCMIPVADKFTLVEYRLPVVPCFVVALRGCDNIPIVAVIVPDGPGAAMKRIFYYSVDLTDSHFFEIGNASVVDNEVNLVVAVPGGNNGPGGALLFAKNKIIYKKVFSVDEVTANIPLICGFSWEQGYHVISAADYRKNSFIFQMESGDIFEATLICEGTSVNEIKIEYIDTIPATTAMCVLEEGFLFMGSKSGNHAVYRIRQSGEMIGSGSQGLKNLVKIDYSKSFTHMRVMRKNFYKEEAIQAVALRGVGPSSSMKTMRLGVAMKLSSSVRPPYRAPDAVWAVKTDASDRFHTYVVMSFENPDSTRVFFMDGELAPENAGVIGTTSSLVVTSFGKNSILQVHRRGVRHIANDGESREFKFSGDIVKVAYNRRQVIAAFSGGELHYYGLLPTDCLYLEGRHNKIHLEVACLSIPDLWEEMKAEVLAVCLNDNTIRILRLSPLDRLWEVLTVLKMSSPPESLLFLYHQSTGRPDNSLFLNIGLKNGALIRKLVIEHGGLLSLPSKYLGSTPIKLYPITVNGQPAILCLSSRIWLGYNHNGRFLLTPLYCEPLKSIASFSSARFEEGMIAIFGDRVGVFTIGCMGDTFNEETPSLKCTTRKFMLQHEQEHITIIGSSHPGASLAIERDAAKKGCFEAFTDLAKDGNAKNRGPLLPSRTIVRDTRLGESCELELELKDNEAAFSACNMNFHRNVGDGPLLVVGTDIRDSSTAGFIHIYRFLEGKMHELLPSMQLEGVPQALCHFGERLLLAGIGPVLRMYELGGAKLHRRCEIELFPKSCTIVSIQVHRNIIFVGDSQGEIHRFEYRTSEDKLYAFKYANVPRRLAASFPIDSDVMAGADKFGNVFFVQFLREVNEVEDDPEKVPKEIVHFHVGDVVTCLLKASNREGDECIIYGTDSGNLGVFLRLSSEDVNFFLRLEMCMRREYPPLCHWDSNADQSDCPRVIDGDLCEQFVTLSQHSQNKICTELCCGGLEILRKLGDIKKKIV